MIEMRQRSFGESVKDAADWAARLIGNRTLIDAAVDQIRDEAKRLQLLKVPAGVSDLEYRALQDEARRAHWYTGPSEMDRNWPALRSQMLSGSFTAGAVDSIDAASTKVVGQLADPGIRALSKKGLVVGHVQSGKTANYAAVLAKAADSGYRLFIVLAGVHNALRSQTQARLDRDVIGDRTSQWYRLTDVDHDFGVVSDGAGLLSARELRNLIVIKKNAARLKRLRDWLKDIPEGVRERCPAVIIDDEADQASPNTKAARDELSAINDLTREIFDLLKSGVYVGYTATPFANVFIDPTVADDLFPENFIIDLPRPDGYFGAEEVFGRGSVGEDGDDLGGHDMVRRIPETDAASCRPPSKKEDREAFHPDVPSSLRSAVLWFVLSIAIRRSRGQSNRHSSMLVHTSQYVAPHFSMAAKLEELLHELRLTDPGQLQTELAEIWDSESLRVPSSDFGIEHAGFGELVGHIDSVLEGIRVVVDNGQSMDRLDYTTGETQSVIAVGGSTLSRGLTLEGLVVSYFLRTSRTYDTLLQMGRWFGFRGGYQDLPRIWVTDEMREQFRFLATIEEELRQDIRRFEIEGVTPRQLGMRIRQHPLLAVTAASKMHNVGKVAVSYGGVRLQTFRFDLDNQDRLLANVDAGRDLISAIAGDGATPDTVEGSGRWVYRDVPIDRIFTFLQSYEADPSQAPLRRELVLEYLSGRTDDRAALWNVAIIGSSKAEHNYAGGIYRPGTSSLGLPHEVTNVVRSRLTSGTGVANIKALMSTRDRVVDLGLEPSELKDKDDSDLQALRRTNMDGRGLLLLYPIAKDSVPLRSSTNREALGSTHDVLGVGIVFPEAAGPAEQMVEEHVYVGLPPDLFEQVEEADDEELERLRTDNEASSNVDASVRLGELGK